MSLSHDGAAGFERGRRDEWEELKVQACVPMCVRAAHHRLDFPETAAAKPSPRPSLMEKKRFPLHAGSGDFFFFLFNDKIIHGSPPSSKHGVPQRG